MSHRGTWRPPDSPVAPPGSNAVQALERVPRAARWLLPVWATAFRGSESSGLEPKVRALVLLRVASVDRSTYWRTQLEAVADEVGLTADEVALVESDEWETTPAFTDRERAAIVWADRVARRLARRDRRAYETVRAHFDEPQLVELTMVAALSAMANRFTNALRIAPEAPVGLAPAATPMPEAALAVWAAEMFDVGSNEEEDP